MERGTIKKREINRNLNDLFDELSVVRGARLSESLCNYLGVERKYVNDAWKVTHRFHQTEDLPDLVERQAIYIVDCHNNELSETAQLLGNHFLNLRYRQLGPGSEPFDGTSHISRRALGQVRYHSAEPVE